MAYPDWHGLTWAPAFWAIIRCHEASVPPAPGSTLQPAPCSAKAEQFTRCGEQNQGFNDLCGHSGLEDFGGELHIAQSPCHWDDRWRRAGLCGRLRLKTPVASTIRARHRIGKSGKRLRSELTVMFSFNLFSFITMPQQRKECPY